MLQVTRVSLEPHNQSNTSYETVTYSTDESNVSYYLTVYAVFAGVNSVFTLFRAFLFAYGGIHAATNIHRQLLNTIMKVNSTGYTQKNCAASKVHKKFISHLTWAQHTPSAAATVKVSHALITILQCVHPRSTHVHTVIKFIPDSV